MLTHDTAVAVMPLQFVPYTTRMHIDLSPLDLNEKRQHFISFAGNCREADPNRTTAFVLRSALANALGNLLPDIQASTACVRARDTMGCSLERCQPACKCMHRPGNLLQPARTHPQVKCNNELPHRQLQKVLRATTFCPVIVGDSAASWRLTEAILAGCIPVILAPPMHAIPLERDFDWGGAAIFINITRDSVRWMEPSR